MIGIVIVLALVAGTVAAVVLRDGDDGDEVAAGAGEEIFLEPVADTGADPFTANISAALPPEGPTTTTTTQSQPAGGITTFQGSRPGLYGGTRSETSCDRARLTSFLRENPDKGTAWAGVLDIGFDEIPSYVDGLTPVLLRQDARVTNHGYRAGRATVIQSVLERGTAVLVDRYGEPVVRCSCGNPLTAPVALRRPRYTGPRWTGFSPSSVTVVRRTTVIIDEYILIDWRTGERFRRPTGTDGRSDDGGTTTATTPPSTAPPTTAPPPTTSPPTTAPPTTSPPPPTTSPPPSLGTGDVQVTLRWGSVDDLDLSVTDPNGETVSFSDPQSSSGGQLDVDSNQGCSDTTTAPVENVFWPTGGAPSGTYVVTVNYYSNCGGSDPASFSVTIAIDGQVIDEVEGTVSAGQTQEVTSFTR